MPGCGSGCLLRALWALHLLFIKRAQAAGDCWSGHLVFQGGVEADDSGPRAAAERETRGRRSVSTCRPQEYLGRLDDLATVTTSLRVPAGVYGTAGPRPSRIGEEVKGFWYPFAELLDPERQGLWEFVHRGDPVFWPSIDLRRPGSPCLWGSGRLNCRGQFRYRSESF